MHSDWRKWTMQEIEAAEREPERYARELAELRAYVAATLADEPHGLKLYRANQPLLHAMAECMPSMRDASLDEALDAIGAVRSHGGKHAAHGRPPKAPRKSRYAAVHDKWLDVAKGAAKESLKDTSAALKRVVVRALEKAAPGVGRRTLAKFVADNWDTISSASRKQTMRNLSV